MPKKKEPVELIEINWDEVAEAIKEPEQIKMSNIFNEMGYVPGKPPEHLLHGNTCWEDRCKYQEYLNWLYRQGISHSVFGSGTDYNNYGTYKRW